MSLWLVPLCFPVPSVVKPEVRFTTGGTEGHREKYNGGFDGSFKVAFIAPREVSRSRRQRR